MKQWREWIRRAWMAAALPLLLLFAIPILSLPARVDVGRLWSSLTQESAQQAILVSLQTTTVSLVLTILLGTPLAYGMSRRNFPLRRLVDALIDLPTVLPPSVAGLALLIAFGRRSLIGAALEDAGISLAFTRGAVILAQVFVSAPFYVRSAQLGFSAIDPEIIQSAQLDGAGRGQMLRFVILPLARVALISGAMMSWARALGEFGATMIFAGSFPGRTQTMPMAIYLGLEVDLEMALALALILLVISFVTILLVRGFAGREDD